MNQPSNNSEPLAVYQESRFLWLREFSLYYDSIGLKTALPLQGSYATTTVSLLDLTSEPRVSTTADPHWRTLLIARGVLLVTMSFLGTKADIASLFPIRWAIWIKLGWSCLSLAVLLTGLFWRRQIRYVEFGFHPHATVVDVFEVGSMKGEFDHFVGMVSAQVEQFNRQMRANTTALDVTH